MLNKIFSWILGNKKPSVDSQITDSVTVEQKQAVGNTSVTASERITITPGLTEDGLPTANAEASIDRSQIMATDDYGFIIDFESFV